MDNIVKLGKPIQFGEETISEIVILEPRAMDLDGMDFNELTQANVLRKLISRCSGVSNEALKELRFSDFMACVEVLSSFLGNSQVTSGIGRESLHTSFTSSPPS